MDAFRTGKVIGDFPDINIMSALKVFNRMNLVKPIETEILKYLESFSFAPEWKWINK